MKVTLLNDAEIARRLAANGTWRREGDRILRDYVFSEFSDAFGFMTRVAMEAHALDHHPDWRNVWNRVEVALTTHRAPGGGSGLSTLDFMLAARMDAIYAQGE